MKKDKIKKISLILGVVFFLVLLFLTYFSSTIDAMLVPNVKVTEVIRIDPESEHGIYHHEDRFLVPIKAVSGFGDYGTVFVINSNLGDDKCYVNEVGIQILSDDGMYYEVTSSSLSGGSRVVYNTSKDLQSGDRVYVLEE